MADQSVNTGVIEILDKEEENPLFDEPTQQERELAESSGTLEMYQLQTALPEVAEKATTGAKAKAAKKGGKSSSCSRSSSSTQTEKSDKGEKSSKPPTPLKSPQTKEFAASVAASPEKTGAKKAKKVLAMESNIQFGARPFPSCRNMHGLIIRGKLTFSQLSQMMMMKKSWNHTKSGTQSFLIFLVGQKPIATVVNKGLLWQTRISLISLGTYGSRGRDVLSFVAIFPSGIQMVSVVILTPYV